MSETLYQQIYATVQFIPSGSVATYGQIATLAGVPGYARQVGYALYRLRDLDTLIPWHRVVNAKGQISYSPLRYGSDDLQRVLLAAEGIEFDHQGRIDLIKFGWKS